MTETVIARRTTYSTKEQRQLGFFRQEVLNIVSYLTIKQKQVERRQQHVKEMCIKK